MNRYAVVALLLLPCACSNPTANESVDAKSDIEGKWVCDFDKTWDKSKEQFLLSSEGGSAEDAQNGDQRVQLVRAEMQSLLAGLTLEFQNDGKFRMLADAKTIIGTYKVNSVSSSRVLVRIKSDDAGVIGFEVTFESKNQMHFKEVNAGKGAPLYVMHRA